MDETPNKEKGEIQKQDLNQETVPVFCYCKKPDDYKPMIACETCEEWFHIKCVGLTKKNLKYITISKYLIIFILW